MILIAAVDDGFGMMFNKRRQSQDQVLREKILGLTEEGTLYMNAYTARQFGEALPEHVCVTETPMEDAKEGEYCFVENIDPAPFEEQTEEILLFKWNRKYPGDRKFTIDLSSWELCEVEEFAGSSHEKITKEIYRR